MRGAPCATGRAALEDAGSLFMTRSQNWEENESVHREPEGGKGGSPKVSLGSVCWIRLMLKEMQGLGQSGVGANLPSTVTTSCSKVRPRCSFTLAHSLCTVWFLDWGGQNEWIVLFGNAAVIWRLMIFKSSSFVFLMSRSRIFLSYVLINYSGYYSMGTFLFFNIKCPWFQCYIFVLMEAWPNKVGYFLGFCIRF